MFCNGFCSLCMSPCYRGEIASPNNKASSPVEKEIVQQEEKGLTVNETVKYEVVKNVFGKEKVRRVK